MSYETITVDSMIGSVGAVISGVDLSEPLTKQTAAEINAAWLKHHVVFFRDQDLTPTQQANFGTNFGDLDVYPFMTAVDSNPNVIPIIKEADATLNFGGAWHTDTSYIEKPPKATLLYAVEVPDDGGDTLFADATQAFYDLSDGLKTMLSRESGIYSPKIVHGKEGLYKQAAARDEMAQDYGGAADFAEQEVEHPLIRTHPDTGEKSIYCSLPHTHRIKGWTREESIPLFKYLTEACTQDKYVTRFKWREGSLALWDNRCVFHNALNDYQGMRRHMHRVIIKGERPQ
ncbi:TauD/TfdA family dioxygenase [Gammaproteobacteria bacterium]|nr:TauD/TfdA family dioxygenase [Gammaproteobacteria bacterium]